MEVMYMEEMIEVDDGVKRKIKLLCCLEDILESEGGVAELPEKSSNSMENVDRNTCMDHL